MALLSLHAKSLLITHIAAVGFVVVERRHCIIFKKKIRIYGCDAQFARFVAWPSAAANAYSITEEEKTSSGAKKTAAHCFSICICIQ